MVQVSESAEGTIIRLVIQPDIRKAFPVRASDARNSFLRHCRNIDHVKLDEDDPGTLAIRLKDVGRAGFFLTIGRKLHERLYRPLSAREAAGVLGMDKKAFRLLREDLGITPCGRIAASRYGRAWSYVVFAVSDVMRMQSMMPAVCRRERGPCS